MNEGNKVAIRCVASVDGECMDEKRGAVRRGEEGLSPLVVASNNHQ